MRIPLQIKEADMRETLEILKKEAENYANEASKCAYCSCNDEIQKLLSKDSLNRFTAITKAIGFPLKDYDYEFNKMFGISNENENLARLMQSWITLGSSVECALQIFLAIHLSNYKDSAWGKWEEFNFETVKGEIYTTLNNIDEESLPKNKRDSLKKNIKEFLKTKRETTHLEQLNLQSLIRFYKANVWWKDEYTEELEIIRQYRNCVHSFKKRDIGEWDRLLDSLKFYCSVLLDLKSMIPDVDDMLQCEVEARTEYKSYHNDY
jgi:membrane-associated HD superfamily phosphohydrolase